MDKIEIGSLVVCHGIKGFHGQQMGGRVVAGPRPAEPGKVWVREASLGHIPGGVPFLIEWPKEQIKVSE